MKALWKQAWMCRIDKNFKKIWSSVRDHILCFYWWHNRDPADQDYKSFGRRTGSNTDRCIPVYGRSADNIRDHRHVTSLLHRIDTKECGVEVTPVLSFDERGHQKNDTTYFVYGFTAEGNAPKEFYPTVEKLYWRGRFFPDSGSSTCRKNGMYRRLPSGGERGCWGIQVLNAEN